MAELQTLEIPIGGMDCAECTQHVQQAIGRLPGVATVAVLLASEKAVVHLDPALVGLSAIRRAVEGAGYTVGAPVGERAGAPLAVFGRRIASLLAIAFGAVLFIVVIGEWLGLFERLTARIPFWLGFAAVVASGWTVFLKVARAALKRQITSHALMTIGALAALAVGQWTTAAVVVFFMRVGEAAEKLTTEGARRAVRDLAALAPHTARVERGGAEEDVPVEEVNVGEIVIVRPGEMIPVDGRVIGGRATVDQSTITGESMPVEAGPGSHVFAATLAQHGSLRVGVTGIGAETTFGRVVKMVEEAEARRGAVQRMADRFSAYYLPLVTGVGALTFILSRNALAAAAVLVVACSCSIALATPIAMLASIGAAARRGLLIKGGAYLEALARADVLLIDKTGTLTLGRPQVTDVIPLNGLAARDVLTLAASAERYSEHPLAEAVRNAGRAEGITLLEPEEFEAVAGMGVRARIAGSLVRVGNTRMIGGADSLDVRAALESQGKTLLLVEREGELCGVVAAADTLRPEVPAALDRARAHGARRIELLTGDNERAASALARALGIEYRANLLPEDKIAAVRELQTQGHVVVMVGDGVNDAPALAQADVGIAMGAAGSDVAIEAAHIALLREDWNLVPEAMAIAQRTMGVVRMNLVFTGIYNLAGIALAALGFLPPILAAAAQSLPDLGILGNSARLLHQPALREDGQR